MAMFSDDDDDEDGDLMDDRARYKSEYKDTIKTKRETGVGYTWPLMRIIRAHIVLEK